MKTILAIALALFATVASAQTCDLNMSMTMLHNSAAKLKNAAEYKGLTAAQAQDIVTRSMAVINEATKYQNKRGDYAFTFDGSTTCSGVQIAALAPIDGMTHQNATKVWRRANQVAEQTIKTSEGHVKAGGKGPWGK